MSKPSRAEEYDGGLTAHGLTEGPELDFKLAGYFAAATEYARFVEDEKRDEGDDDREASEDDDRWWKKWAKKVKKPLGWANVLLKSLSFIPGGGATEEIKSGTEKAVDDIAG